MLHRKQRRNYFHKPMQVEELGLEKGLEEGEDGMIRPVLYDKKKRGCCGSLLNMREERRFDTIGNISDLATDLVYGISGKKEDILFVVYTEREKRSDTIITRIISARKATNFERGLYYGKY